jgi:uncharacterized membrane protein
MLTDARVQALFTFCSRHYVRYYDVQIELVDHMANAVEGMMTERPQLSFEAAVELVYISFGSKGFGPIVQEKTRVLGRRNRRELKAMAMQCFSWPTAVLTVGAAGLQWFVYNKGGAGQAIIFAGLVSLVAFGVLMGGIWKHRKRQIKPLLANDFMHSQYALGVLPFIQIFFLLMQILNFYNMSVRQHIGVDLLLIVLLDVQVFLIVCVLMGMKHTRLLLQRQYPLAFQV